MMQLLPFLQAASGANVTVWSTPQWINELDTALQVRASCSALMSC